MELLFNHKEENHLTVFKGLIAAAEEIILCTGWMKNDGLNELKDDLKAALRRKAHILVISNSKDDHTEKRWIRFFEKEGVKHILVKNPPRYFHTKLYYFRSQGRYTAIIGSANLTEGALKNNEELSVVISGDINDASHLQLSEYFRRLNSEYGLDLPSEMQR